MGQRLIPGWLLWRRMSGAGSPASGHIRADDIAGRRHCSHRIAVANRPARPCRPSAGDGKNAPGDAEYFRGHVRVGVQMMARGFIRFWLGAQPCG